MKNKGIKMKKTIIAASIGSVVLTGCSSTHSEKWNEIGDDAAHKEVEFQSKREQMIPEERPLSRIINDNYVDVTPMEIIQEDKNSLPSIFHKKFLMFGKAPMPLKDVAAAIYLRTGLSINYVDNKKELEEEAGLKNISDVNNQNQNTYFDPNQSSMVEELLEEELEEEETESTIKLDHTGTLKQLLDYISVKKGLKWKFDQASNKVFVYTYDTKTYTLLGFGEKITKESSITTTMSSSNSGDNGDSASENEQSINIDSETEYWEDVKASITDLVSKYGSVTFNDSQNKVIVTDSDFVLSSINSLVNNLNDDAFKEITLEVEVLNLTVRDTRDINTSLDITGINDKLNVGFGDAASLLDNFVNFDDGTTSAMISLLDEIGTVGVETKVTAVTLNNMPIPVQLTQNRSYIEQISVEKDPNADTDITEVTVGMVAEGITMTITPKAVGQNILIDYSMNLSSIDSIDEAPGDVQIQLPITSTKNFVQRANLKNGVPRVIATVERKLESADSSHPFNENLWFIGGSEGVEYKKDILMVVVTPHITNLK